MGCVIPWFLVEESRALFCVGFSGIMLFNFCGCVSIMEVETGKIVFEQRCSRKWGSMPCIFKQEGSCAQRLVIPKALWQGVWQELPWGVVRKRPGWHQDWHSGTALLCVKARGQPPVSYSTALSSIYLRFFCLFTFYMFCFVFVFLRQGLSMFPWLT